MLLLCTRICLETLALPLEPSESFSFYKQHTMNAKRLTIKLPEVNNELIQDEFASPPAWDSLRITAGVLYFDIT